MAKIKHLVSETAGTVPASLLRGQVAINVPDKLVYANDPSGKVSVISSGSAGLAGASGALGVHMPTKFMPACQLGPGLTQEQLTTLFTSDGTTITYNNIPIFALGQLWWTGKLTCAVSASGVYVVTVDTVNRTARIDASNAAANSGNINYSTGVFQVVVFSNGIIYPWFYLPAYSNSGTAVLLRISPTKTFGAIPVSEGFAGAPATSYWGAP
jgi:hypothetical protein